jgi:acetyltransferase-like isoleucine patch superfamily enzyme
MLKALKAAFPLLGTLRNHLRLLALQASNQNLTVGRGCRINDSSFGVDVRLGERVTLLSTQVSDRSYIGNNASIAHAKIGKYCSLASDLIVGAGTHPTEHFVSTHPIFYLRRPGFDWEFVREDLAAEFAPTVVGNDVWIGAKGTVIDGVRIGNGAVIGAGAVVVKDADPYGIYVGIPAKLVRYRFSADERAFLEQLRWWDRDDVWLRENAAAFRDIKALKHRHG